MKRRRNSKKPLAFAAACAAAVHLSVFVVVNDDESTVEAAVRAVFERQRAQLEARDYEGLWQGLSAPYRAAILRWEETNGRGGHYHAFSALRIETTVPVDDFPGFDLAERISIDWDGQSELRIQVEGRAARAVFRVKQEWCFLHYARVDGRWYLDGVWGCTSHQETLHEYICWTHIPMPDGYRRCGGS